MTSYDKANNDKQIKIVCLSCGRHAITSCSHDTALNFYNHYNGTEFIGCYCYGGIQIYEYNHNDKDYTRKFNKKRKMRKYLVQLFCPLCLSEIEILSNKPQNLKNDVIGCGCKSMPVMIRFFNPENGEFEII